MNRVLQTSAAKVNGNLREKKTYKGDLCIQKEAYKRGLLTRNPICRTLDSCFANKCRECQWKFEQKENLIKETYAFKKRHIKRTT